MNATQKDEPTSDSPAIKPKTGDSAGSRIVAGVLLPDTPVIASAIRYARENSETYLFNHVMRSWLFAVSLAELRKATYDREVMAVATLLHDIGLAEAFNGPLRFEVEGANAARKFAQSAGLDDRQCQLIWDTVALNSTPSIALYKEAEVSLSTAGIALDWGGWGYDSLPPAQIAEIVAAFPRLEMKTRFAHAVCHIVETRPASTYDNFAGDFGERLVPGYKRPSIVDFLTGSPFSE